MPGAYAGKIALTQPLTVDSIAPAGEPMKALALQFAPQGKIKKEVYIPEIYMGTNYIETKYPVEIYNLPKEKNINNPDMYFVSKTIEPWNWFVLGISRNGYLRYFNSISYISKSKVDNKRTTLYVVDKNSGVYSLIGKQLVNFPTRAHHDSIKKGSNYIYLSFSELLYKSFKYIFLL